MIVNGQSISQFFSSAPYQPLGNTQKTTTTVYLGGLVGLGVFGPLSRSAARTRAIARREEEKCCVSISGNEGEKRYLIATARHRWFRDLLEPTDRLEKNNQLC